MDKSGRGFEIIVVDDGSTDAPAIERVATRDPKTRLLRHDSPKGFGASLRTALAEAHHPLFFYTAVDYPYSPSDIRSLLERIAMRDEFLGKQPDLISGCRTGLPTPMLVRSCSYTWKLFWRVFAGMPMSPPAAWHGWSEFWYRSRVGWIYGIPLTDVNSCFKLFRTDFLRRFPIQSDGDFVHTELVAKATFLTSIMDEVPLTPKPDAVPRLGVTRSDSRRVFGSPEFRVKEKPPTLDAPPPSPEPIPAPVT
jgi:glycosyltransferase involved in cell wall biosynthesis